MPLGNSSNANACNLYYQTFPANLLPHSPHQPHCVLLIRSSKICWPKDMNRHFAKPMHRLDGCIFTDAKILIGIICSSLSKRCPPNRCHRKTTNPPSRRGRICLTAYAHGIAKSAGRRGAGERQRAGQGGTVAYRVGERRRHVAAADSRWLRPRPGTLDAATAGLQLQGTSMGGRGSAATVGIRRANSGADGICSSARQRSGGFAAAALNWVGAG
jgi:hypothetical protein